MNRRSEMHPRKLIQRLLTFAADIGLQFIAATSKASMGLYESFR
jgi:hypothetical protein